MYMSFAWSLDAFYIPYFIVALLCVTVRVSVSWRDLARMSVSLQLFSCVLGALTVLLYGSPLTARAVDSLLGRPGIHVPVRDVTIVIACAGASSLAALWFQRRPRKFLFSTCAVALVLLVALANFYVDAAERGELWGIRLSFRPYVAVYHIVLYLYVTYAAMRLAPMGSFLRDLRPEESEGARGMQTITVAAWIALAFTIPHLAVTVTLWSGMRYNYQPILHLANICYAVATLSYIVGICYPAFAKSRARRRLQRTAGPA
jgi:hypothetical protein